MAQNNETIIVQPSDPIKTNPDNMSENSKPSEMGFTDPSSVPFQERLAPYLDKIMAAHELLKEIYDDIDIFVTINHSTITYKDSEYGPEDPSYQISTMRGQIEDLAGDIDHLASLIERLDVHRAPPQRHPIISPRTHPIIIPPSENPCSVYTDPPPFYSPPVYLTPPPTTGSAPFTNKKKRSRRRRSKQP